MIENYEDIYAELEDICQMYKDDDKVYCKFCGKEAKYFDEEQEHFESNTPHCNCEDAMDYENLTRDIHNEEHWISVYKRQRARILTEAYKRNVLMEG